MTTQSITIPASVTLSLPGKAGSFEINPQAYPQHILDKMLVLGLQRQFGSGVKDDTHPDTAAKRQAFEAKDAGYKAGDWGRTRDTSADPLAKALKAVAIAEMQRKGSSFMAAVLAAGVKSSDKEYPGLVAEALPQYMANAEIVAEAKRRVEAADKLAQGVQVTLSFAPKG